MSDENVELLKQIAVGIRAEILNMLENFDCSQLCCGDCVLRECCENLDVKKV